MQTFTLHQVESSPDPEFKSGDRIRCPDTDDVQNLVETSLSKDTCVFLIFAKIPLVFREIKA